MTLRSSLPKLRAQRLDVTGKKGSSEMTLHWGHGPTRTASCLRAVVGFPC